MVASFLGSLLVTASVGCSDDSSATTTQAFLWEHEPEPQTETESHPSADPEPSPEPSRDRSQCEAIARAALRGEPSPTALSGRRAEDLAHELRDIYDCRAVALDDVQACAPVAPSLHANCRARWRFFHDARTPSPSWPAVMAAGIHEDCVNPHDGLDRASCDQLRDAIRTQSPDACASMPERMRDWCRALATSDPGPCPDDDCRELAGRLRMLVDGGGLERIAREGTQRDRVTAAAALRGLDACEPLIADFSASCGSPR